MSWVTDNVTSRAELVKVALKGAERPGAPVDTPEALRTALEARAREWRDVLAGAATQARQLLRKVLLGPIVCTPERREVDGWAVRGAAALDRVTSGANGLPRCVASPICASWNQLDGWLRQLQGLRRRAP